MANVPFSTSRFGKKLDAVFGGGKPTIGILGDSYGETLVAPAIRHCLHTRYAADVYMDDRPYVDGGQRFAVGGTPSTHVNETQIAQFQQRPTDIAFIATGWNNVPGSLATAQSVANDIITAGLACIAAGAQLIVLHGQGPHNTTAVSLAAIQTLNTLLEDYCRNNSRFAYVDITSVLIDPVQTSTTSMRWKNGVTNQGSFTHDGVHASLHANRQVSAEYENLLRMVARQRRPRASMLYGVDYSPTLWPDINILGDAGIMSGTSGQLNSVNNASVAGTPNAKINIIRGGDTANFVVTPSIVIGPDGFRRQRMELSGTIGANSYIYVQCIPSTAAPNTGNAANLYDSEAVVELNAVTGLYDYQISGGPGSFASPFAANSAHLTPDGFNEKAFLYSTFAETMGQANPTLRLLFWFRSGKTVSGSIDVGRWSVKRVAP